MAAGLGVPQDGAGTVLSLGTSAWEATALLTKISFDEVSRNVLETSNLLTSTSRTYIGEDLRDSGGMSLEFLFHDFIATTPPMIYTSGVPSNETIIVTFPIYTGQSTAALMSVSGCCISYTPPEATFGELLRGAAKFKFSGDITFTAST